MNWSEWYVLLKVTSLKFQWQIIGYMETEYFRDSGAILVILKNVTDRNLVISEVMVTVIPNTLVRQCSLILWIHQMPNGRKEHGQKDENPYTKINIHISMTVNKVDPLVRLCIDWIGLCTEVCFLYSYYSKWYKQWSSFQFSLCSNMFDCTSPADHGDRTIKQG